jgi:hypothetical protein
VIGPRPAAVVLRVVWILSIHDETIDGVGVGKDGVEKECEHKPSSEKVKLCLGLETWAHVLCAIAWAGIRLLLKAGNGWEGKSYPCRLSILAARGPGPGPAV